MAQKTSKENWLMKYYKGFAATEWLPFLSKCNELAHLVTSIPSKMAVVGQCFSAPKEPLLYSRSGKIESCVCVINRESRNCKLEEENNLYDWVSDKFMAVDMTVPIQAINKHQVRLSICLIIDICLSCLDLKESCK
jgi:hypothetical protein